MHGSVRRKAGVHVQEWLCAHGVYSRVDGRAGSEGESLLDALRCELCMTRFVVTTSTNHEDHPDDSSTTRVCSWLRCRILGIATALLVCIVTVCVYAIIYIIPDAWDGMVLVLFLTVLTTLFFILRVLLDPRCYHACLCHDLRVLEQEEGERWEEDLSSHVLRAAEAGASVED